MSDTAERVADSGSALRTKSFRVLLLSAAGIGVLVSIASWGFLQLVHGLQEWVYVDLPRSVGFDTVPWWWPIPVLLLAGVVVAVAVARLPGRGGHEPADGIKSGPPTQPVELPSVLLASVASIGLGMVLGPEGPLLAIGMGLTLFVVRRSRRQIPDQAQLVLAAAGSFAALSTIFGSPVIGAVIIIEAAGLGGPTLPLILLPGLIAAGIGSLVFIGIGSVAGLSTSAYAISPLSLPAYPAPNVADFAWTVVFAIAAAVFTFMILEIARTTQRLVAKQPFAVIPVATLIVALLAIVFSQLTDQPATLVLLSGQDSMDPIVEEAATVSVSMLALLLLFKGLAWGVSLGSARGGPTFPALFLGVVGGLLALHLPGFSETPAVAALMGAMCVSILRLPLASVVLAIIVTQAGLGVTPLIIVGVIVAYLTTLGLAARRAPRDTSWATDS
jgi:H+/Cl- antiporter ClcA